MLDGKTVSYKNMRGDLEEGEIIHVYSGISTHKAYNAIAAQISFLLGCGLVLEHFILLR